MNAEEGFSEAAAPLHREPECPTCGGRALPILYGFPSGAMFDAERRGGIVLGGCRVTADAPTHECRACASRWQAGSVHDNVAGVAAYFPGRRRR